MLPYFNPRKIHEETIFHPLYVVETVKILIIILTWSRGCVLFTYNLSLKNHINHKSNMAWLADSEPMNVYYLAVHVLVNYVIAGPVPSISD